MKTAIRYARWQCTQVLCRSVFFYHLILGIINHKNVDNTAFFVTIYIVGPSMTRTTSTSFMIFLRWPLMGRNVVYAVATRPMSS